MYTSHFAFTVHGSPILFALWPIFKMLGHILWKLDLICKISFLEIYFHKNFILINFGFLHDPSTRLLDRLLAIVYSLLSRA